MFDAFLGSLTLWGVAVPLGNKRRTFDYFDETFRSKLWWNVGLLGES